MYSLLCHHMSSSGFCLCAPWTTSALLLHLLAFAVCPGSSSCWQNDSPLSKFYSGEEDKVAGCQTWQEGLVMCNSGISCCRWAVAPWNTSQLRSGCGLGGVSWPDALHLVLDTGCFTIPFLNWWSLASSLTMIVHVNVVWLLHTRQSLLIQVFRPERGDWNVAAGVLEVVQNCTKILPWRGI